MKNRNLLVEPVEIEVAPECAELLRIWDMASSTMALARKAIISDLVRKQDMEFMGIKSDGNSGT